MEKIKRTVQKQKIKDFCIVLLFFVFFPYTCTILFTTDHAIAARVPDKERQTISIELEKEYGKQQIPLGDYLMGVLAAAIPGSYEKETIKAQCIIIRSACLMQSADYTFPYLPQREREIIWGEQYSTYSEKFKQAIKETEGLVVYYRDELVSLPYFRLSNGVTRNVGDLSFLRSVPCNRDILSREYLNEITIKADAFFHTLDLPDNSDNRKIVVKKDTGNYVKQVTIGEKNMTGEEFRNCFSICSSSYSVREENNSIVIQTKGIGHGIGFSQYAANQMALDGDDCISLLNYFFQNINIQKIV